MKTINMDYEEYIEELAKNEDDHKNEGVSLVMKFLEGNSTLKKFLIENRWISEGANLITGPLSDWHWVRIAKATGRDIE